MWLVLVFFHTESGYGEWGCGFCIHLSYPPIHTHTIRNIKEKTINIVSWQHLEIFAIFSFGLFNANPMRHQWLSKTELLSNIWISDYSTKYTSE
jgi:hypothetical protein